ncbi:S8 family serine peptidase [Frankia sp. Cppng1_Ct_nod]|uniref:S8 family serine peptidase n=1 Tax=Frankia sp. Cppng1_Ct_nod TaxID=2897162 RepID=UPI0020256BE1|nr:S8 family serine peptidase [Frankia sp. Cppng1_Ct_nod]
MLAGGKRPGRRHNGFRPLYPAVVAPAVAVVIAVAAQVPAPAPASGGSNAPAASQSVTVYLTAPDPVGLGRLARSVAGSVTGSPRARADILREFLPSPAAHDSVAVRLRALGLTVTAATTWSVTAAGTAARVRELFGSARNTRQTLRYAQSLPVLPETLHGLVSVALGGDETRPAFRHLSSPPSPTARAVPAADGYTGPQLRAAYDAPDGHRRDGGPDPTVATLALSGWDPSDLSAYAAAAGIPDPVADGRYTAVGLGRSPDYNAVADGDGDAEVTLDQESLLAVAPTARQRVYIAPNTDQGYLDVLDRVRADAADPATDLVAFSMSWGMCEAYNSPAFVNTAETLLAAIAVAGVTTFAASGDSGSDDCDDAGTTTSYPASSPSVITLGGTTLLNPTGAHPSETAWAGSGGGCSTLFTRPGWQPATRCASRALPDLAMDADPTTGFAVYHRRYWQHHGGGPVTGWVRFGGTSLAAPVAAGMLAAVWASRGQTGGGYGDIHDQVYGAPPSAFRDITTGGNGAYRATVGYDLATGRGAPLWNRLATVLTDRSPANGKYVVTVGVGVDRTVWAQRSGQAAATSLGGQATSVPTVVQASGHVTYIVGGTDGNLWMRGGTDPAWSPLGPPGTRCSGQAAIAVGSVLHIGCRGSDQKLYVTTVPVDSTGRSARATSWTSYGGQSNAAPAVAVVDGVVTWFVTGINAAPAANLYRRTATSGWTVLGVRCDGGPGAGGGRDGGGTRRTGGPVFLGCRSSSEALVYAAAPFTRFVSAGGKILGVPGFARVMDGIADVFVAGTDAALYSRRLSASAPRDNGWTKLGGVYLLAAGAAGIDQEP